jgi:hypothetical protein
MNARLHFHWNRLIEDLNPARPAVQQFLDAHANRLESLIRVIQARSYQALVRHGAARSTDADLTICCCCSASYSFAG